MLRRVLVDGRRVAPAARARRGALGALLAVEAIALLRRGAVGGLGRLVSATKVAVGHVVAKRPLAARSDVGWRRR